MGHDVEIDVPGVRVRIEGARVEVDVRQVDLGTLTAQHRLAEPPIVARVCRTLQGGGFGDPESHPYAWGVFVKVDGRLGRLTSARGTAREWTRLDRLEPWLRAQGFRRWSVVNELEPAP